jgi:hypothetical protein
MTKKDPSQEETTQTPTLEEPTSASGVNFGQKVFANTETGITIEVEGLTDAGVETSAEPAPPAPSAAPRAQVGAAKATAAPAMSADLDFESPPPATSSHSTAGSKPALQHKSVPTPAVGIPATQRTPFFSPTVIMIAMAAAGFYFYQRNNHQPAPATVPTATPTLGSAAETPAPPPIQLNSEPLVSPLINLNKPVVLSAIEDESAVYVLKSDSDDFMVLVNGKDMPVISGKITLPLNRALDISFVRRGYKDIKMQVNLKKPETKDVVLKFEKDPNAPGPRRLYN